MHSPTNLGGDRLPWKNHQLPTAAAPQSHSAPSRSPHRSGRLPLDAFAGSVLAALGCLSLACLTACEGLPGPNTPPQAQNRATPPPKRAAVNQAVTLASGDVIKLLFPGAMEYSNIQRIRSDGKVSLPLVGDVQAAGRTPEQLRNHLTASYKDQLTISEVVVTLESDAARVVVSGAVAKPGSIGLDGATTVLEAIMAAGGFSELANLKKVHLIRESNGEHRTEILDLRAAMKGQTTKAIDLKAGDMIYVPQKVW